MSDANDRFRTLLKETGLSQESFAKRIKRSRGEIANIVYGKVEPKKEIIEAACETFGFCEDWLRYGLEPMRAEKTSEEEISELVGAALDGSSDFKRSVIKMICSRTDKELDALEAALRAIYEGMKKE